MRQVILGLCAFAMLVAFQGAGDPVTAQGKKKAPAGVIEIGEGKDGKYRFFVRDSEGKLLAMSGPTGFLSVKDAESAIDALKEVVATAKVSTVKKDSKKEKDKDK